MEELKPCPCGKPMDYLCIAYNGQGSKWANVGGNCCGMWSVEFRTQYHAIDTEECMELAKEAWNAAPRAGD